MLAGTLGADGGIVWIVAGVWAVRRVFGRPPGIAWGLACLAASLRWGTLSLGDLQAATRALGPTVGVGSSVAAAAAAVTLTAALIEIASDDDLRSRYAPVRVAAAAALVVLVPAYLAPGVGEPSLAASVLWWAAAAAAMAVLVLVVPVRRLRVPAWVPVLLAAFGTVALGAAGLSAGAP